MSAAICLLSRVRGEFLPPDLALRLESLLPDLVEVPVEAAWNAREEFFAEVRPRILITGWGAPRLPASRAQIPELEYVCHLSGTVRDLVPRSLLEEGLIVTNWGTSHAPTVAECALMLALATLRRVTESTLLMHGKERGWKWPDEIRPRSLYGRRVGLHGFGAVARALLPLLQPFGVSIQAYSEGVPDQVFSDAGVRQAASLEALFSSSDVLIEVEALTPTNRSMVTGEHLRMLPGHAVFVNVGRAGVVDERGLLEVALEGKLQIGLDVYHAEPLPAESPLRGLGNVCLLGHQAGPTPDRRRDCGEFAIDNIQAFLEGKPLRGVVNVELYDRAT